MYAATKEHFSDRKLKKATGANYVRNRESSIKTITRQNFGPGSWICIARTTKEIFREIDSSRYDFAARHWHRTACMGRHAGNLIARCVG